MAPTKKSPPKIAPKTAANKTSVNKGAASKASSAKRSAPKTEASKAPPKKLQAAKSLTKSTPKSTAKVSSSKHAMVAPAASPKVNTVTKPAAAKIEKSQSLKAKILKPKSAASPVTIARPVASPKSAAVKATPQKVEMAKVEKVEQKVVAQAPAKATTAKAPMVKAPMATVQAPVAAVQLTPIVVAPAKVAAQGAVARPVQPAVQRAMPAMAGKPASPKLTAPSGSVTLAQKAIVQQQLVAAAKKPVSSRHGFKTNEFIVYPAHGVGRIVGIEEQEIAGISLELFVIQFEKDKMTLRVPTSKLASVGMRKLAEDGIVKKAMETLKGKARIKRTMWSRRAQEYEAKINSGDLVAIAEVVRDLYRSEAQPEQSYSERQLYEAALDRMAREIAAVDKVDERGAMQRITEVLSKSARGRRAAEEEAAAQSSGAEVKAA